MVIYDKKEIRLRKRNDDTVAFNPDSLRRSLSKSGASEAQVKAVYQKIESDLYDGMTTDKLYTQAFAALKKIRKAFAARYSLKRALQQLGPEGYYFEHWIGRLFQEYGYQTIIGKIVEGKAITHEIDVIAQNDKELLAIECKFRNDTQARISITTPMAFMSRLNDIIGSPHVVFGQKSTITNGWLVTNTYFSKDSIRFAEYYALNILAWSYPIGDAIRDKVDSNAEYPVTCLTTLSKEQKRTLLHHHCILVKDVVQNPGFLAKLALKKSKEQQIIEEATELIQLG